MFRCSGRYATFHSRIGVFDELDMPVAPHKTWINLAVVLMSTHADEPVTHGFLRSGWREIFMFRTLSL